MTMKRYDGLRERLRTLRLLRGDSQLAVSAQSGLSLVTVATAERAGLATPRTLQRLADALGVAPAVLSGEAQNQQNRCEPQPT